MNKIITLFLFLSTLSCGRENFNQTNLQIKLPSIQKSTNIKNFYWLHIYNKETNFYRSFWIDSINKQFNLALPNHPGYIVYGLKMAIEENNDEGTSITKNISAEKAFFMPIDLSFGGTRTISPVLSDDNFLTSEFIDREFILPEGKTTPMKILFRPCNVKIDQGGVLNNENCPIGAEIKSGAVLSMKIKMYEYDGENPFSLQFYETPCSAMTATQYYLDPHLKFPIQDINNSIQLKFHMKFEFFLDRNCQTPSTNDFTYYEYGIPNVYGATPHVVRDESLNNYTALYFVNHKLELGETCVDDFNCITDSCKHTDSLRTTLTCQ